MWSISLFRDTPVPLLIVRRDGRIALANPAACALFGRNSLAGHELLTLVEGVDRERLGAYLRDCWALRAGDSAVLEDVSIACAGGPRPGHLIGSLGAGERGPVVFVSPQVPAGAAARALGLDDLTGVDTRHRVMATLGAHVAADATGCVLLVDIDQFEDFNIGYGVAHGDQVLVEVARRLKGAVPVGAALARWDGDAFLVVAPGTPMNHGLDLGRALLAAVSAPMDVAGTRTVTVSIGIASLAAQGTDEVLTQAAWALDSAKAGGGRQVVMSGPVPRRYGRRRSDLIAELRILESNARSWRADAQRSWTEARTDSLTGLPNNRAWEEFVVEWPDRERRRGSGVAVVFIDFDEFGLINKTFDQAQGDVALKSVAAVLRAQCRGEDLIFRHGGEEFVVVLPDTDSAGGRVVAERMRAAVESAAIPHNGRPGRPICTISAGVASGYGSGVDLAEVTALANAEGKRAKAAGRNCVFPPVEPSPPSP